MLSITSQRCLFSEKGLKLAIELNLRPLKINIISKKVINMLQKGNLLYDSFIIDGRSMLRSLGGLVVQHSLKEQNRVAGMMTKKGVTLDFFNRPHVSVIPTSFIRSVFWENIIGISFSRTVCSSRISNDQYRAVYVVEPN